MKKTTNRIAGAMALSIAAGTTLGQSNFLFSPAPIPGTVLPVDVVLGTANLVGANDTILFTTRDPATIPGLTGSALTAVIPSGQQPDAIFQVPGLFERVTNQDITDFLLSGNVGNDIDVLTGIRDGTNTGPQNYKETVYQVNIQSDPTDLVQVRLTANPISDGLPVGLPSFTGRVLTTISGTLTNQTGTVFTTTIQGEAVPLGAIPRIFGYDVLLGTDSNYLGFYPGAAPGGTEAGNVPYYIIIDNRTGTLTTAAVGQAEGAWDLNVIVQTLAPALCNGPGSADIGGTRTLAVQQVVSSPLPLLTTPANLLTAPAFQVQVNTADAGLGLQNQICAYFDPPEDPLTPPSEFTDFAGFINEGGPEWVVEFTINTTGALTIEDEFADAVNDGVLTTEDDGPSRFFLVDNTTLFTGTDVLGDGTILGVGTVVRSFVANSNDSWPNDFDNDGVFDADSLGVFEPGTYYLIVESDIGAAGVSAPGPVDIDVYFHSPLTCGNTSSAAFIPGSTAGTGVRASDFVFTTPINGEVVDADALGVSVVNNFGASVICGYQTLNPDGTFGTFTFAEFQDVVWENTEIVYEFTTTVPLRFNVEDETPAGTEPNVDIFLLNSNEVFTGADLFADGGSTLGVQSRSVVAALIGDGNTQGQGVLGGVAAVQDPGTYYLVFERYRSETGERAIFLEFLNPLPGDSSGLVLGLERTIPELGSSDIINLGTVAQQDLSVLITMCFGLTDVTQDTHMGLWETETFIDETDADGNPIINPVTGLPNQIQLFDTVIAGTAGGLAFLDDGCTFPDGPSSLPVIQFTPGDYILAVSGGDHIVDPGTFQPEGTLESDPPVPVAGQFRFQGIGTDAALVTPRTVAFDLAAGEVQYYQFTISPTVASGVPTDAIDLGAFPLTDSAGVFGIGITTCLSDPGVDTEVGIWDADGVLIAASDNSACFSQGGLHSFQTLFTDGADGDTLPDFPVEVGDRFYVGVTGANTDFLENFSARTDPLSPVARTAGDFIFAMGPEFPTVFNPGPGDVTVSGSFASGEMVFFTFTIGEPDTGPVGCNLADISDTPPGSGTFDQLDGNDISAFVSGFIGQDPIADISDTPPGSGTFGQFDGNDISAFVSEFIAGCPA